MNSTASSGLVARELVMAYGSNATSYQILSPGIAHWFAPEIPAVDGYTQRLDVLLARVRGRLPVGAFPQASRALLEALDRLDAAGRLELATDLLAGSLDRVYDAEVPFAA